MTADFNSIINSGKPVLVDFYTEWCESCRTQVPILEEIAHYLGDRIKVIKIDIDKNRLVALKYGIGHLPTLMLFRNGKLKWQQAGLTPRSGLIEAIFNYS
ncbi:MAG TPA: thioredoxin domain-containing protein [Bacteroidales bacterium]|jgi:thioredoxin 1|nr:thioredoxin domain-containing protein [Bacteroidales bacterium]